MAYCISLGSHESQHQMHLRGQHRNAGVDDFPLAGVPAWLTGWAMTPSILVLPVIDASILLNVA
ncbi:hypothetical protein [Methylomonas sp. LW13]|uniref:hypothetical protein n=1 Tax=Methylomonas sp. LW13 TaxID=107637 RepID=UPI001020C2F7|nr:hypothetical protein [Methylomonas sp. LW13]